MQTALQRSSGGGHRGCRLTIASAVSFRVHDKKKSKKRKEKEGKEKKQLEHKMCNTMTMMRSGGVSLDSFLFPFSSFRKHTHTVRRKESKLSKLVAWVRGRCFIGSCPRMSG